MNLPGVTFHSSEAATSAYRPSVTFATAAIPEPATAAIIAAACVLAPAVVSRRRRAQGGSLH